MTAVDEHFNFLYSEVRRFQTEQNPSDNSRSLNAENLPKLLREIAVDVAQKEVDGLLRIAASRGVDTVGDLRRLFPYTHRVHDAYKGSDLRREPSPFELVACLLALNGVPEADHEGTIAAQIEYAMYWIQRIRGKAPLRPGPAEAATTNEPVA